MDRNVVSNLEQKLEEGIRQAEANLGLENIAFNPEEQKIIEQTVKDEVKKLIKTGDKIGYRN